MRVDRYRLQLSMLRESEAANRTDETRFHVKEGLCRVRRVIPRDRIAHVDRYVTMIRVKQWKNVVAPQIVGRRVAQMFLEQRVELGIGRALGTAGQTCEGLRQVAAASVDHLL